MIPWRSTNLSDTNSWRAWNGSAFAVPAVDAYTQRPPPHGSPVPTTPLASGSLVWSAVAAVWLLVGGYGPGPASQFAYATSPDLITWSATADLMPFNWEPKGRRFPGIFYPSVIDIDGGLHVGNNFPVSGRNPHLYYLKVDSVKGQWVRRTARRWLRVTAPP